MVYLILIYCIISFFYVTQIMDWLMEFIEFRNEKLKVKHIFYGVIFLPANILILLALGIIFLCMWIYEKLRPILETEIKFKKECQK